jgi:hypothetical protein
MDVTASMEAPCPPDALFEWVEDLSRYPRWLEIVPRAELAATAPGEDGPAWSVDLRGRLGPFARSKRLRMVRTAHTAPLGGRVGHVRFERRELDAREHSPWVLHAAVEPSGEGSRLAMHLHYGGRLWVPALDRLLTDEIERSQPRLLALLATGQ